MLILRWSCWLHGDMPWDENEGSSIFLADRMFLITAIKHSQICIKNLDYQLQLRSDNSCHTLLENYVTTTKQQKILDLRNMNEHYIEYLVGSGRKQDNFRAVVRKNSYSVSTNAFWTIVHGDAKLFLFGGVEIDKLLIRMKENLLIIRERTQEIFNHYDTMVD